MEFKQILYVVTETTEILVLELPQQPKLYISFLFYKTGKLKRPMGLKFLLLENYKKVTIAFTKTFHLVPYNKLKLSLNIYVP